MTSDQAPATYPISRVDQRVTMVLLFLVSLCNYLDRYMLGVLLPDIKADLHLSDTQLGFIGGTAFTLFYAAMGIPIGRLADKHSRRLVLVVALSLWSAMTAICGAAQSFAQLAVARILVGVGEAGATPPAHSLIADIFPIRQRAGALAVYTLGSPLGVLIGFSAAGLLSASLGWRWALILLGLPGLLLAAAVFFFLTEPRDRHSAVRAVDGGKSEADISSLRQTLGTLFRCATFWYASLGTSFYTVMWMGMVAWLPSYFVRTHGMPIQDIAPRLAIIIGVSQLAGLLFGGLVSDWLARFQIAWYMRISAIASFVALPFYVAGLLAPTSNMAQLCLFLGFMVGSVQSGPSFAAVQNVSGPRSRAVAVAANVICINVFGGLGVQIVGIVSDNLTPKYGPPALGYTIAGTGIIFLLLSTIQFWLASRTIARDTQAASLR